MSKPTSQDIIDSGSYLEPFFDPSALLVANLRAILQHHDIQFPANATKVVLIKHFKENIAPNAQELRRQKKAADGIPSDASDILDVETGEYLQVRRGCTYNVYYLLTGIFQSSLQAKTRHKTSWEAFYSGHGCHKCQCKPRSQRSMLLDLNGNSIL